MKILFIQTGGTIDKDYPKKVKGYFFEIAEPAVKRIMKKVNPKFEYSILQLIKKDSLEITNKDRDIIYNSCRNAKVKKIIITHGTDTMIETAKKLSTIRNKVIILTGAILPEKFNDSDAMFNIGTAVGAINILNKGVYIAMNGKVYPWDETIKSQKTGKFIKR